MNNFVSIDVITPLEKSDIYEILTQEFQGFNWRMGEHDVQGGYISGRNHQGVNIKCWTDENPMEFSISFRPTELESGARAEILENFLQSAISRIGKVVKIDNT